MMAPATSPSVSLSVRPPPGPRDQLACRSRPIPRDVVRRAVWARATRAMVAWRPSRPPLRRFLPGDQLDAWEHRRQVASAACAPPAITDRIPRFPSRSAWCHRWVDRHITARPAAVTDLLAVVQHRSAVLPRLAETTTPFIDTVLTSKRIAFTAAASAPFLSPRPTHRAAAIAPASVTRASSRARFRSGACRPGSGPAW
jgi:hypothetical protein